MPAGKNEYLLNCCINDEPDRRFLIRILKAALVSELKDAICDKNRHTFNDIDARSLVLWRVSVPEEDLHTRPNNILYPQGLKAGEELRSLTCPLSEVFAKYVPQPGHIHIIVEHPVSEYQSLYSDTLTHAS